MCNCYLRFLFLLTFIFAGLLLPQNVTACGCGCDPCLVVYPTGPTIYRYDPASYYTVTAGHPMYDLSYDRGGEVLIRNYWFYPDRIAYEVYQAPNLTGFQMSSGTNTGFYFTGSSFDLVIDGWSRNPMTRENIKLVFEPIPEGCTPTIIIDGVPVTGPPYVLELGDLVVSTPVTTPTCTFYSDTIVKFMEWGGCDGLHMIAYEDCNHDHHRDPCIECEDPNNDCCDYCHIFCSHGATVPVEHGTWGAIKMLYK